MGVAEELSEVSEGGEADILEALLRELGKVALGKRAETVLVPPNPNPREEGRDGTGTHRRCGKERRSRTG